MEQMRNGLIATEVPAPDGRVQFIVSGFKMCFKFFVGFFFMVTCNDLPNYVFGIHVCIVYAWTSVHRYFSAFFTKIN